MHIFYMLDVQSNAASWQNVKRDRVQAIQGELNNLNCDYTQEIPERPPTCFSSYQWLGKRGTWSHFRTRSQPA